MKILVVEDEKKIASFVRKGLEAQGFVVDVSHHGDEGFTLATTQPYDAVVLDIMLPGKDGLSILRNLRDRKNPLPVILLTARSELNERLEGLNLGADDYLTKPFHIEELIARLHAVTRRAGGTQPKHPDRRGSHAEPVHPRSPAGRAAASNSPRGNFPCSNISCARRAAC
jgi:two-component system OmpR family response regulator